MELAQAMAEMKSLTRARKKVEKVLGSSAMSHTFQELRHYRKPKRAVVATIAATLMLSCEGALKATVLDSLPPGCALPEAENAMHPIWLGVQKALGPKVRVLAHRPSPYCADPRTHLSQSLSRSTLASASAHRPCKRDSPVLSVECHALNGARTRVG